MSEGAPNNTDNKEPHYNWTLGEIMARERELLARLPDEAQAEYHRQGREIQSRLLNKMLYGNEEGKT